MSPAEQAKSAVPAKSTAETSYGLEDVIQATKPQSAEEEARAKDYFREFLEQVVKPGQLISKDVEENIKFRIAQIDQKLSAQLNEIMHEPEFQRLEGTWRGLHYLVDQTKTGEQLKLRVLNVSKRELFKD